MTVNDQTAPISVILAQHDARSFLVIQHGNLVFEWYAEGHDETTTLMLFSASKSITSMLIGAAIDDGLIASAQDPVAMYIPELADGGFDKVTIEAVLRMDSNSTYVEDDNPFGVHVEFNYTADLEEDILALEVRDDPHLEFTYKSGDNAILGLILDRVLDVSISEYLQARLLEPLGTEHEGIWSTDTSDGLERTWCCLALTSPDFARFGQLVLDQGTWNGVEVVSSEWFEASRTAAYSVDEWPSAYDESRLSNYGYQWWLVGNEAVVALGKDGQYLYTDLIRDLVIVRTGNSQGGIAWIDILYEVAHTYPAS